MGPSGEIHSPQEMSDNSYTLSSVPFSGNTLIQDETARGGDVTQH